MERRRLDAVGAVAEVGDVEVALEDLLLGVLLLVRDGQLELAGLARQRGLGGGDALLLGGGLRQQRQLDELLGDRRAALGLAVGGVVDRGAKRALEVECTVLVEPRVLDREDRLLHDRRDLRRAVRPGGSPGRSTPAARRWTRAVGWSAGWGDPRASSGRLTRSVVTLLPVTATKVVAGIRIAATAAPASADSRAIDPTAPAVVWGRLPDCTSLRNEALKSSQAM